MKRLVAHKLRSAVNSSAGFRRGYSRLARVFSPTVYASTSAARNAWVPHSDNATTRTFGEAERFSPDRAYPNSPAFAGVSGTSTSNPSMASSRQPRSHVPRVNIVATGSTTPSNTSANTSRPNRLRAWVIPLAVGTDHEASQHPHRSNDPVTFVATSS